MLRRFFLLAAIVTFCWASAASAQPGKQPGGGFGGFGPFQPPRPGEILAGFVQDVLKLDADQKKQLADLQKEVDAKLAKILNEEQRKSLDNMKPGKGGFGFGPPGFNPPGGGSGAAPPGGVPGGPPPKMGFGGPGFGGPGFGGFGPGNAADTRKLIGATEEEWKVIGPKLQKVTTARRALSGEGASSNSALASAQADLKTVLDEPKHSKAEVDEKIAAVRKAREKAREEYAAAQRDLMQLLTPSQQAIMVGLGHLE